MEGVSTAEAPSRAWSEIVTGPFDEAAAAAVAARARRHLGGRTDLAFLFVSCDLRDSLPDLIETLQIHAHCPRIVGCSAGGLIGVGREEEGVSGFSLLALRLSAAEVWCIEMAEDAGFRRARASSEGCGGWIVLGNPVLLGEEWLARWNAAVGSAPTYGGLASGSSRGEDLFVFDERGVSRAPAIVAGFRGAVKLSGLVSQGCRPIGEPLTITRAQDNLIHQLACQSAFDQLQSTFHALPEELRDRAQGNILVGLAMSEYVEDFHTGDFLVRSILGGDPGKGILAVGAHPRVGQTLQFQLRDREAADLELRALLEGKRDSLRRQPLACMLFSCAGRGRNLFGAPHHDAGLVEAVFGPVPLAGLLCNGEIGSVGNSTYLHGFTASAVFLVAEDPAVAG